MITLSELGVIKTPCVGVCSTGLGDDVCRGCKRYAHEVIGWNGYSYNQKALIENRLVHQLTRIIQNKIVILDELILQKRIEEQQLTVSRHRNIYCQAYELIKVGASQIKNLELFGMQLSSNVRNCSLKEICEQIDQEFYALSVAYYERNFRQYS